MGTGEFDVPIEMEDRRYVDDSVFSVQTRLSTGDGRICATA